MEDVDPRMNANAVSVYDNAPTDDFPVLKAFQQYIDAEQAKARKRVMMLCVFFSFFLIAVIAVFVGLLLASGSRNQALNDRLVEYVMRDRDRTPAVRQDDAAIRALSEKLESLQSSLAEKKTADTHVKRQSVEAKEIERLKALLSAEKAKAEAEHEKLRQAELEAYRRKHYPEFYGLKPNVKSSSTLDSAKEIRKRNLVAAQEEADREIESIINEVKPVSYFDEEDEEEIEEPKKTKVSETPAVPEGVKDSSGAVWSIPEE